MRFLFTMQLGMAAGCSLLALAGCGAEGEGPSQPTRDVTGSEHGRIPVAVDTGVEECPPLEVSELELNDETVFGDSAIEMFGSLIPGTTPIPFFWVGYDDLDAPVSYSPGVGETQLELTIWLHEDAVVLQTVPMPSELECEKARVTVPVHMAVSTQDGALSSATFDTKIVFERRDVATLGAEIASEALGGSLAFENSGALAADWTFAALGVDVLLWAGGTSGHVTPRFARPPRMGSDAQPPLRTGPESQARAAEGLSDVPSIPAHWSSLGVWPRREGCANGVALGADERQFGWSPREAVAASNESATFSLLTEPGPTPVRVTLTEPSGLLCARQNISNGNMEFVAQGRLSAEGAAAGSPFEHLDLSDDFRVSAKVASDHSGFTELAWQRWAPEKTAVIQSRDDFTSSTGIRLNAEDPHPLFWWTWASEQLRVRADEPWWKSGELVVYGADRIDEVDADLPITIGQPPPPATKVRVTVGETVLLNAGIEH